MHACMFLGVHVWRLYFRCNPIWFWDRVCYLSSLELAKLPNLAGQQSQGSHPSPPLPAAGLYKHSPPGLPHTWALDHQTWVFMFAGQTLYQLTHHSWPLLVFAIKFSLIIVSQRISKTLPSPSACLSLSAAIELSSSCLSLLSPGITDMCHYIYFLILGYHLTVISSLTGY